MAAGAGAIDRADKRDCYQQKYGSEEGVNDHHNAPELPLSDACGTPAVHYLFSMGYRSIMCKEVVKNGHVRVWLAATEYWNQAGKFSPRITLVRDLR